MDYKKWLRVAVCLLLVLCFLVNVSPIKAKAVDPVTITAAAILGVSVLALSAYCGFALAPPDVDFVEDVGEEFSEFVQYVSSTGGLPDDDDDDTNNGGEDSSVDELIEQITSSTMDQLEYYTDSVGDAIKGNRTFYDAAIFGGFAGLEPAFKLFLKWMIQNGYFDRTIDVPASSGWSYYGDFYYPTFPEIVGYPYMYITNYPGASNTRLYYLKDPVYYKSNFEAFYSPDKTADYYFINLAGIDFSKWDDYSSYSVLSGTPNNSGSVFSRDPLWCNVDIIDTYSNPQYCYIPAGPLPSSSAQTVDRIEPLCIVPDSVAAGIVAGGLVASDIIFPEKVDHGKLFSGVVTGGLTSAYSDALKNAQGFLDGTTSLTVFQQNITYTGPLDSDNIDPSDPTDSTEPSIPIPVDGTLGGTPVGDFFTNLGNLIMSPFEWIWNKIEAFFDPWINSIGDWFSQVRGDLQAIPGKFQKWFTDIIDGITNLPGKFEQWFTDLIDGIKNLPNKVAEAFQKLLFPSNDYLTDKVDQLTGQFAFADSIVKTGQALHLGLAGVTTEPPVIYIDLGAARGFHDIGGRVPFLDLRWYAEYKPTVDTIISAFLWICFVWRMLIKLPGIISGMPGDFVMTGAHAMGLDDMLPSRKKEYEIQRIDNRQIIRKGRGQ